MALAIIQARISGGSRFGGPKVLAGIEGETMLGRVIDQVLKSSSVGALCVAIPDTPENDELYDENFVVRGPEDDVLARYYLAVREYGLAGNDIIVRVTADCPLIAPEGIDAVVAMAEGLDDRTYATNTHRYLPHGFDCQAFTFAGLKRANERTDLTPEQREHVVLGFENCIGVRVPEIEWPSSPGPRLTVDYPEDLEVVRACYRALGENFTTRELLDWLAAHPEVVALNAHRVQR
jgi:spore coat polysaccharide biosynthesis protein SpsF